MSSTWRRWRVSTRFCEFFKRTRTRTPFFQKNLFFLFFSQKKCHIFSKMCKFSRKQIEKTIFIWGPCNPLFLTGVGVFKWGGLKGRGLCFTLFAEGIEVLREFENCWLGDDDELGGMTSLGWIGLTSMFKSTSPGDKIGYGKKEISVFLRDRSCRIPTIF